MGVESLRLLNALHRHKITHTGINILDLCPMMLQLPAGNV